MHSSKGKLAIIPARGGSKRIPGKNKRSFLGQPIIAYSIQTALRSNLFDEVMVSTDDEEIAQISLTYGAQVPFLRTQKNADDYATTTDVILEVIEAYSKQNFEFENCCCIYPTAPLMKEDHLKKGYEILMTNRVNAVFPVVPFGYPIWRGIKINESGSGQMIWPEYINSRSQDLQEAFHDAGQWYWLNVDKFKQYRSVFSSNMSCMILSQNEVQDIDNIVDWELAEIKFQLLNGKKYDHNQGGWLS